MKAVVSLNIYEGNVCAELGLRDAVRLHWAQSRQCGNSHTAKGACDRVIMWRVSARSEGCAVIYAHLDR